MLGAEEGARGDSEEEGVTDLPGGSRDGDADGIVAQVDGLADRIRDRIVRPWRELVLAAALGPGVAATVGGDLESGNRGCRWRCFKLPA